MSSGNAESNPIRDKKNEGTYWGGEGTTHPRPRLVKKIAQGKTFWYELSWKVKATMKEEKKSSRTREMKYFGSVLCHLYSLATSSTRNTS